MRGTILQVNISPGGIPKLPIAEGRVGALGIEGDSCRNTKYHGGPKQALLLISIEDIETLRRPGFPIEAGTLGENLTIQGIDMRAARIGDRFQAGEVILEITKPRQPCKTLDQVRPGIQKELTSGKGGFYASVLKGGLIRPGDIIAKVDHDV